MIAHYHFCSIRSAAFILGELLVLGIIILLDMITTDVAVNSKFLSYHTSTVFECRFGTVGRCK